jgi:exonuclease VII large subunit
MVLARGYAIVLNDQGQIVKESASAPAGSEIRVLFARDGLKATVTEDSQ